MIKLLDLDLDDILLGDIPISEVRIGSSIIWPEGGSGEGEQSGEYIPGSLEPNSDVIFIDEPGAPNVKTDSDGLVTEFNYTQASNDNPVVFDGNTTVDTGFVPMNGELDFELYLDCYINYADQSFTKNWVDIISCIGFTRLDSGGTKVNGGFELRLMKSGRYLNLQYTTNQSNTSAKSIVTLDANVKTGLRIRVTKVARTVTTHIEGYEGKVFDETTHTFTMTSEYTAAENDLLIAGRKGSDGSIDYRSKLDVNQFYIRRI